MADFSNQFYFQDLVNVTIVGGGQSKGTIVGTSNVGVTIQHEDNGVKAVNFYPWTSVLRLYKKV